MIRAGPDPVPAGGLATAHRDAPAWIHRLHADGPPNRSIPSEAAWRPASQRFVDRWHGVTSGY